MRQFFFVFVLVAYIWAAPTGRPEIDRFDSNAIGIARTTAKMQSDWAHGQYAALMEVCPEAERSDAIRALLFAVAEGWHDEAESPPQLTAEQRAQVVDYEGRVLALETAGHAADSVEKLREIRNTQGVLYSDILAWAHRNHRVSPAMVQTFVNEPSIVRFDSKRAEVQFCAADRSKAATNTLVTFEKSGARWTWPLADRLTLLLGEARRLELAGRVAEAKDVLKGAKPEEQKEKRFERVQKRLENQAK